MAATHDSRREKDNEPSKKIPHHPFSDFIMSDPLPRGLQPPRIPQYDGFSDPEDHLALFNAHMLLYGATATDPIMCRAFPCTLKKHALRWFFTLPSNSISSFSQLTTQFLNHFALSRSLRKTEASIKNIKQGPNESLQDYFSSFNHEAIQIENLDHRIYMMWIEFGLRPGPFLFSLTDKPPLNLDDLWRRAARCMNAEAELEGVKKRGRF